jgi:hypothetical protein
VPATKISNPRDFAVQLMGELLFVERRLADQVIGDVAAAVRDDELASAILDPRLADLFHAQSALHVEHWEMAAYRALLPVAADDVRDVLRPSFDEEGEAAKLLVNAIDRLAH